MRTSRVLRIVFPALFFCLFGAFLYYLFYKPVEGFFAKSDACEMATKNRDFILGQVNDVSKNLNNLDEKIKKVSGIRDEIQRLLDKNSCLTFNISNQTCFDNKRNYDYHNDFSNNYASELKKNNDIITDLTPKIKKFQDDYDANNVTYIRLTEVELQKNGLTCDPTVKNKTYPGETSCAELIKVRNEYNTKMINATFEKNRLQPELTNATSEVARLTPLYNESYKNKLYWQGQLNTNKCFTVKSSFLCTELGNQLKFIDVAIKGAENNQIDFKRFFDEKTKPLTDINTILTNSCS